MRYLALTICINNEIPDFREGLMRKISDFFIHEKGYHFEEIRDKSTKPEGFYLFETHNPEKHSLSEFTEFLDNLKEQGVVYELIALKDISELLK